VVFLFGTALALGNVAPLPYRAVERGEIKLDVEGFPPGLLLKSPERYRYEELVLIIRNADLLKMKIRYSNFLFSMN
jgi:hypothetical protein